MFIPGFIINWLTFPGVIIHEYSHKKMCDWRGIYVQDMSYFSLDGSGYVKHRRPRGLIDTLAVSGAPLVINTLLTIALTAGLSWFALMQQQNLSGAEARAQYRPLIYAGLLLGWLGFSIGAHALPSSSDLKNIWREVKSRWNTSVLAFLLIPVVFVFYLLTLLRFFWIDFIYAAIIMMLTYACVAVVVAPQVL